MVDIYCFSSYRRRNVAWKIRMIKCTSDSHPSLYYRWLMICRAKCGVCQDWKRSFSLFANWSIGFGYREDLECLIERADKSKPYSHYNCRIKIKGQRNRRYHRASSLYAVWSGMKRRCLDTDDAKYPLLCDAWLSLVSFETWALANGYEKGLRLDRLDSKEGYYPDNCRWTTVAERRRNKRTTRWVLLDGEKLCFSDAADKLGIDKANITRWFSSRKVPTKYAARIELVV